MNKVINRIDRRDVTDFAVAIADGDVLQQCKAANLIDIYQELATKSAIYPGQGTPLGLMYVGLKLNGEAGEMAEHTGKAFRDDGIVEMTHEGDNAYSVEFYELTPERRALIVKEIGDMLWYLSAAANELRMNLSDIALANLEKLCDRSERDALRGSGDER